MLPCELKLVSLNHCFIQLPESILKKETLLKHGSIICLRSIQSDKQLYLIWNGQIVKNNFAQLDITFAQANGFKEELVVINFEKDVNPFNCSTCRVELIDSSDYTILSQHSDIGLLDTCRLVNEGLILPIWVSKNVHTLVRVTNIQPDSGFALLTDRTEMQYTHNLEGIEPHSLENCEPEEPIKEPIPIISCTLFSGHQSKLCLGSVLVIGERGSGKTFFLKSQIEKYKRFHGQIYNCKQLRGKRPEAVKKKLQELLDESLEKQPSILGLDDIDSFVSSDPKHEDETGTEAIYNKRLVDILCDLIKQIERTSHRLGRRVIILGSSKSLESLDARFSKPRGRQFFTEIIKIICPNLQQRVEIIKSIASEHKQVKLAITENELEEISMKCNTFMPLDLKQVFERAIINSCSRSFGGFDSEQLKINPEDVYKALDGYVSLNLRGVSLKLKTGRTFAHVGGMDEVKDTLRKTILLPLKYPRLFKKCPMKPMTSILLYGPPGCGKTLVAEALTNEESINSISVKGPELLSKYIGASEAAVRDLFRRAELARPCVIFFDEFDSLVAKRGTDSSGVTDRVVNQFLTILDGVDRLSTDIFIVAATSRPDIIDPAMLRPGRLDKHLYCPIPNQKDRLDILRVLMQTIDYETSELDLHGWSDMLEGFTGADIQSLLYSAQLKALHDLMNSRPDDRCIPLSEREIKIMSKHIEKSFLEMQPEIEARYPNMIQKYPKSISKLALKSVSTRATLA